MITTSKHLTVTIDITNAVSVATAKASFVGRLAMKLLSDSEIKGKVESKVESAINIKLASELPRLVMDAIQKDLTEQGIEAKVKVL